MGSQIIAVWYGQGISIERPWYGRPVQHAKCQRAFHSIRHNLRLTGFYERSMKGPCDMLNANCQMLIAKCQSTAACAFHREALSIFHFGGWAYVQRLAAFSERSKIHIFEG